MSTLAKHPGIEHPDVSPEQAERALQALLCSRTFERSGRLRAFLQYVCEMTLNGEGEQINEYLVGVEVFGRGRDYSPTEDSVVRRQAHALRAKLEKYYAEEGLHSPLRIELPIGCYVPVFRPHEGEKAAAAAHPAPPKPESRNLWPPAALAVIAAAAVFFAGWLAGTRFSPDSIDPVLHEIWGPWLTDPSGATISFSNPKTSLIKHYLHSHREADSHTRLAPGSVRERSVRAFFELPAGGELCEYLSVGQGKMGEAMGAVRLAALFGRAGVPVRSQHSRFLDWGQLRRDNVILFGHSESNDWVDQLLEEYPIHVAGSTEAAGKRILNPYPRPGEREVFDHKGSDGVVYVLLSMLPGIDDRHRMLCISGMNAMAAQFGAEFLTSAADLEELAERLRAAAPGRAGPWHFQVVLSAEVRKNILPTRGKIELLRVLPGRREPGTAQAHTAPRLPRRIPNHLSPQRVEPMLRTVGRRS